MARPIKQKLGILSKDEKIYIAEHFLWYDNEWIAKKLKRGISYINTYVDRLKHTGKEKKIDETKRQEVKKEIEKRFNTTTGNSTVMTPNASTIEYKPKKYESPFKV